MAVRLLLDENLSERLLRTLEALFPGSNHIRRCGKAGMDDHQVWEIARAGDYILVTRDEDFVGMSVLRSSPPKVVWLDVGNMRNAAIADLLQARRAEIESFATHEEYTFLVLTSGLTPN